MPNLNLGEVLEENQFVEKIYQTSGQEYWSKAIATLSQFFAEYSLNYLDSLNKFANTKILLTNSPQLISNNFSESFSDQTWLFTTSQSFLLPSTFSSMPMTHIVKLDHTNAFTNKLFLIFISQEFVTLFFSDDHKFLFSLHPEPISIALLSLKQFITDQEQLTLLNQNLAHCPLVVPSYKVFSKFALALLIQSFPQELPIPEVREIDTIKAIAHEVKTPLTTIKTLLQLLLRREDLTQPVRNRIEKINFECQDQIDRFNLIFEIVQLHKQIVLTDSTDLAEILENNIDTWQKQAQRRQLNLKIDIIKSLPLIITNKQLLSQLLNGLIDRLTRSLPAHSKINISMAIAGKYIKLQFQSEANPRDTILIHKAIGQWLMIQPETGTLSLSLMISKVLFELIGGKLTVKTNPTLASYDGEILTIFLPIKEN